MTAMRLLVTGGAGFIGSHYVRRLLAGAYPAYAGAQVTVLDKLTYAGNQANLAAVASHPSYRFVRGDIADRGLLDEVLPGHDVVLNFAAETHVDRSLRGPADFVVTNVLGTQTLLDAGLAARERGVAGPADGPVIVQVSTDEVYGSIADGSWAEGHAVDPSSPYSAAKAGGDLLALAYARTYGLDVRVTRCTNNYGPYQFPEKVIPLFVTNLLDGLPVPLYGDGDHVRDWLHVDDHCRGIQVVLECGSPGEVYHVGGGRELSNRALTAMLLAATGRDESYVQHVTDRLGHDRRYCLDDAKLRALGYAPATPFEEGLAATVRWYAEHEDWWRSLRARAAVCP
jgi:dTDP-glucose 4,6-dehydratase